VVAIAIVARFPFRFVSKDYCKIDPDQEVELGNRIGRTHNTTSLVATLDAKSVAEYAGQAKAQSVTDFPNAHRSSHGIRRLEDMALLLTQVQDGARDQAPRCSASEAGRTGTEIGPDWVGRAASIRGFWVRRGSPAQWKGALCG
jgi:hypothetical protein